MGSSTSSACVSRWDPVSKDLHCFKWLSGLMSKALQSDECGLRLL